MKSHNNSKPENFVLGCRILFYQPEDIVFRGGILCLGGGILCWHPEYNVKYSTGNLLVIEGKS